jgi:hypothetical protein
MGRGEEDRWLLVTRCSGMLCKGNCSVRQTGLSSIVAGSDGHRDWCRETGPGRELRSSWRCFGVIVVRVFRSTCTHPGKPIYSAERIQFRHREIEESLSSVDCSTSGT